MKWTPDKIKIIEQMFDSGHTDTEIAKELGVTSNQVAWQRHKRGLVHYTYNKKLWSQEDIDFLKAHYNEYTYDELCELLNRPESSIREKCSKLGLYKNHYVNKTEALSREYKEMGEGEHRGFTVGTAELILQYFTEGYDLKYIAKILGRDYNDVVAFCREEQNKLLAAHTMMVNYNGVYARRLQQPIEEVLKCLSQ